MGIHMVVDFFFFNVGLCHKTLISNYDFDFLKHKMIVRYYSFKFIFKIIIINYDYKLKFKTLVGN